MIILSLNWTCQRDRVSLLVKFGLKKKKNLLKKNDNDEFEFKLDLLERQSFTSYLVWTKQK